MWPACTGTARLRLEAIHGLFMGRGVRRLVMDAQTMRVLWVGEGNSRESIRPFLELLGEAGCKAVEAVAMHMTRFGGAAALPAGRGRL